MKLGLLFIAMISLTRHADDPKRELHLRDLRAEIAQEMQRGTLDGILKIEKGEEIEWSYHLSGDVLTLCEEDKILRVKAKQTMYMQYIEDVFWFSLDQIHWKTFSEMFGGTLSFNLGDKIELVLDLHLKPEKQ